LAVGALSIGDVDRNKYTHIEIRFCQAYEQPFVTPNFEFLAGAEVNVCICRNVAEYAGSLRIQACANGQLAANDVASGDDEDIRNASSA